MRQILEKKTYSQSFITEHSDPVISREIAKEYNIAFEDLLTDLVENGGRVCLRVTNEADDEPPKCWETVFAWLPTLTVDYGWSWLVFVHRYPKQSLNKKVGYDVSLKTKLGFLESNKWWFRRYLG